MSDGDLSADWAAEKIPRKMRTPGVGVGLGVEGVVRDEVEVDGDLYLVLRFDPG